MSEEPIDFSALDPSRDAARWDRAIAGVVARAQASRKPSVVRELSRTGGVILALAAAAAAASWLLRKPPAPRATAEPDTFSEFTRWASGEDVDPLGLVQTGGAP